jgi:hypothetical protein
VTASAFPASRVSLSGNRRARRPVGQRVSGRHPFVSDIRPSRQDAVGSRRPAVLPLPSPAVARSPIPCPSAPHRLPPIRIPCLTRTLTDKETVVPLAPEPIINQDGTNKNDCERNASKRLWVKFRREHPHLPVIVVADGLASNAPYIRLLKDLKMHFLLVAKPSDHQYLFQEVAKAIDENRYTIISWHPEDQPDVLCEVGFAHDLPLNQANPDVPVRASKEIDGKTANS